MSLFKQSFLDCISACESPFHITEQLTLQQVVGNTAAIDSNHWPLSSGAGLVYRPGDQLLAGAALSGNQNGAIIFRSLGGQREDRFHGPAFCHQAAEAIPFFNASKLLLKYPILAFQLIPFFGLTNGQQHFVAFKRFGYKVVSPQAHGLNCQIDGPIGRHHNNRSIAFHLFQVP